MILFDFHVYILYQPTIFITDVNQTFLVFLLLIWYYIIKPII